MAVSTNTTGAFMKKNIMNTLMLILLFASPSVLAEWTIPGTNCAAYIAISEYHDNAIVNMAVLDEQSSRNGGQFVICSTPVHNSYGPSLEMQFLVHNASEATNDVDNNIICTGYSYDEYGNKVQQTHSITKGFTERPTKILATQKEKLSDETPVTVAAQCFLPPRSLERNRVQHPSKLISIRVH